MAFNVSSLSAYVKPNENTLIVKSYFTPKTAQYMQKLTGIKYAMQIPNLQDDVYWKSDSGCGLLSASGDTTISSRTLTIGRIKIEKSWCIKDLETAYTQLLLSPGANYEALPGGIDEAFMTTFVNSQAEKVEKAIWQSSLTVGSDINLRQFDGLIKIIGDASASYVAANASAYMTPAISVTSSNIITILQAIYAAMPVSILDKEDTRIFIGTDWSRLYQTALVNANLFNFVPSADALGEYYLHGTNVKIVPVPGLSGTNKGYGIRTSNMFLGVDLESEEEEEIKVWYSQDYDTVNLRAKFKLGTQVGFTNEIVVWTL